MPTFLNEEQNFSLIMSELPDGVYATDRADNPDPNKRSWSSSENRSWAKSFTDIYSNMKLVYLDKFITTASADGIALWEAVLFDAPVDATLDLETRRARCLAKYQYMGGISYPVIYALVASILTPIGVTFDIVTLNGARPGGAWIFEVSHLGLDTYLVPMDPIRGNENNQALDCSLDYAGAGLTQQQLTDIQNTAYTYLVRITGTADPTTLAFLDQQLTALEPARSTHFIINNFSGSVSQDIDGGDFGPQVYYDFLNGGDFGPAASYNPLDGGTF